MTLEKDALVLDYLLNRSVEKAKKGKTAIQLSGGLDSALLQTYARSKYLYCVTWLEEDNITSAKKASGGKYVEPVSFSKEDMIEVLPRIKDLTNGEGTWTQVCQWFICKKIAEDGCDTVITGEGSDELFGGYARYRILWHLDNMYSDLKLINYRSIIEHMFGLKSDLIKRMLNRVMGDEESRTLAGDWVNNGHLTQSLAVIEESTSLPKLLRFAKAMAEDHGLNCEFPFMDSLVTEFAHELPENRKIDGKMSKAILREIAAEREVDQSIVYEITKKGLFIPQQWRPRGEPMWSRAWFDELMRNA